VKTVFALALNQLISLSVFIISIEKLSARRAINQTLVLLLLLHGSRVEKGARVVSKSASGKNNPYGVIKFPHRHTEKSTVDGVSY
jgi:hypothetical protein